jgi:hypothetical protein
MTSTNLSDAELSQLKASALRHFPNSVDGGIPNAYFQGWWAARRGDAKNDCPYLPIVAQETNTKYWAQAQVKMWQNGFEDYTYWKMGA